jgi:hypothetical protein
MTAPIKLKAEAMWAYLDKKNDMSDKYQIDLCNLSPAAVSALEDMGISVPSKDGKGFYITCKSSNPIRLYNANGHETDGGALGNGSEMVAVVGAYSWTFKNKEGISPALKKLVVTNLVEYGDGADDVDVEADDIL